MEFLGKPCQLLMGGIRIFGRLCFGDDEHGCVMVDAVGSGHLAVSECRLNIGHAIPHRTKAIPGHTTPKPYLMTQYSVPLNIGWAHLAEPIAQGHASARHHSAA